MPLAGVALAKSRIEAVRLGRLVEFRGTLSEPVANITLKRLTFRHAARTFMQNKEPLLRSDWTTYRGGALVLAGTEHCAIEDCFIDQVGGNAIFFNNYNRHAVIRGCHIARAGANGVAFVGDPAAVRNPLFEYGERQSFGQIDKTPGPKTRNFPADCLVEDCLIYQSGRVEKQTAPIQIAMSQGITVRHCSLYDAPRAGINIGDGCWGGHLIEFCDIFDTVKETGDHGSFNSWGRDRYWGLTGIDLNQVTLGESKDLPLLDVIKPIILRNNRWRCDHGWDIDLDDGSSNYIIRDNLCLNGGIKLREGFYRVCENNIMVNNSFHPHVWYGNSQDVFRNNIVFTTYRPIQVNKPWGATCDFNLLHDATMAGRDAGAAEELQRQSGRDEHSLRGDAMFEQQETGDYRVREGSPALKLGFKNFAMDQFGVEKPSLKTLARTPELPGVKPAAKVAPVSQRDGTTRLQWLGASVKNLSGAGELSATGLAKETGALLIDVPSESEAAELGFQTRDVILQFGPALISGIQDLAKFGGEQAVKSHWTVWRDQKKVVVSPEKNGSK
jgi:hypothetical protein